VEPEKPLEFVSDYLSPLGRIVLAADGTGEFLTGLWFEGQAYFASGLSERRESRRLPVFEVTAEWLDRYFSGEVPVSVPPLLLRGTPFRRRVWNTLLTVPYGAVVSYGELAGMILRDDGDPGGTKGNAGARAVGSAVGHNPVSLIVPCHRIVGADGSLTGYAGGIGRKLRLLELERGVLC